MANADRSCPSYCLKSSSDGARPPPATRGFWLMAVAVIVARCERAGRFWLREVRGGSENRAVRRRRAGGAVAKAGVWSSMVGGEGMDVGLFGGSGYWG